jgi:hypothetical protein
MGQPVRRPHQRETEAGLRVRERDPLGGAAEPDPLLEPDLLGRCEGPPLPQSGEQLPAQLGRRGARADTELAPQHRVHPLELAQRRAAIPGPDVLLHEREVRRLVARIQLDQPFPTLRLPEQRQPPMLQSLPGGHRPRLVQVRRQRLVVEAVQDGRGCLRRPGRQREFRRGVELGDVDLQVHARQQRDHLAAQDHGVRPTDRLPGVMRGLVQARRRLDRVQIGPQGVHHLLAVKLAPRGQRQDLHQGRRVAAAPRGRRNGTRPDHHPELPQQVDTDSRRRCGALRGDLGHAAPPAWACGRGTAVAGHPATTPNRSVPAPRVRYRWSTPICKARP